VENNNSEVRWEPLDDIGYHMTMEEFISSCECGGFIDYDGFGYYASADRQTDKVIIPSHVMSKEHDETYSHVMWYNR